MHQAHQSPPKVTPADDNGYFEEMTKAIFRAGFSWPVVHQKWEGFRKAFEGFDLDRVAAYGPQDIDRLCQDAGIIRNRRKITATVQNAGALLDLIEEHGSTRSFLRSLDQLDYGARVKTLTGLFAGMGRTSAFVFLHCVNEETPAWRDR